MYQERVDERLDMGRSRAISTLEVDANTFCRQGGDGVTIVDAGGGMLDISAYAFNSNRRSFEEIAESQCEFVNYWLRTIPQR